MKDLRPPTCRTHSIVTHTTCSSTHMYTLTNACIIYAYTQVTYMNRRSSCRQASYLFTCIQRRKEVAKFAAILRRMQVSEYVHTHTSRTWIQTKKKHTHTHTHTHAHTHPVFKTHRVLHFSSSSHPPVSTAMALYSC